MKDVGLGMRHVKARVVAHIILTCAVIAFMVLGFATISSGGPAWWSNRAGSIGGNGYYGSSSWTCRGTSAITPAYSS